MTQLSAIPTQASVVAMAASCPLHPPTIPTTVPLDAQDPGITAPEDLSRSPAGCRLSRGEQRTR